MAAGADLRLCGVGVSHVFGPPQVMAHARQPGHSPSRLRTAGYFTPLRSMQPSHRVQSACVIVDGAACLRRRCLLTVPSRTSFRTHSSCTRISHPPSRLRTGLTMCDLAGEAGQPADLIVPVFPGCQPFLLKAHQARARRQFLFRRVDLTAFRLGVDGVLIRGSGPCWLMLCSILYKLSASPSEQRAGLDSGSLGLRVSATDWLPWSTPVPFVRLRVHPRRR